ncbi:MAG: hypothetical protein LKF87_08055 [Clostridium tyrobutyricum]|jgi:hypothetical protein|uniref:Uncharacterized protein n=1 Tax=Clostridium coskatii TaxID=1705578 RepID=A0A162JCA9_9CLOT|nr:MULTISPECIES: hypothetical protein [Clostridium]MCH4198559.1 hypothetical protein [Clostridium tyrobutyricum]MCH4258906.1 hypothetical protein [Clostridium tyrobutyricum]MCI1239746.1 hypothetical protein [Clostridium tyrobutyricum]MCI1651472.1 hypothetical protein [Clostridium tyrobutyricum]OAA93315.1 hypothetical protein WX73_00007 [Clostridium coskatii]
MSLFSRSSGKRHHDNNHRGSSYYKREGFLNRILGMFGSFSRSGRKYNKYYSHNNSYPNHYSGERHCKRRKYKSSWS